MWLLDKQYKEDAEELRRAYTAKQKMLETSLTKLRKGTTQRKIFCLPNNGNYSIL